ncbi:MAG: hypothetical protein EOR53_02100 [Mesorhizobium sp.]|uniref:hypothetical protein n=3 Tax=Mesorhizobium sp. TaxID=1871066 RepID=UPI000FE71E95|nr:hypothetical protein [Mesorhizobium sp.]RWK98477.1 MAG: hypothetical protein EOR53_02100 [Mesorhizobium sp.]RWL06218.1 MAG: hypothetical protein EOR45_12130 [Mesorhizobium sp.]TIP97811.1 MAG: hypothetical protein E5X60_15385 [Mesorhizobium sp.]TIQ92529.1 MAG: hypothetical protein E5X44_14045 [Mesorhizobium sp.]TJW57343.1 MAG: hypothetical protein E5X59_01560 [Mesorhizobium sp.]
MAEEAMDMVLDTRAKQVADKHNGIVHHGIVVIGAGFDSAFFLQQFVGRKKASVPVLEWGCHNPHDRQLERGANSNIRDDDAGRAWNYTIGLTAGPDCGSGQTPPFNTNIFGLKGPYGIGLDSPIRYGDLLLRPRRSSP